MRHPLLLAAFVFVVGSFTASAQQKRIYIAPDDHTDYFWTADDVTYRKAFVRMLDYYMALADRTDGDPVDFQSRFACDCSLWLWEYEHHRSPVDFARLIARIRDGHISAPLNASVTCYGGIPAEAVLRGMYYSGHLERRFGLRFEMAVAMENQTLPYGLPSLWAGAGARYSWRGICGCASQVPEAWDREHDIYWATGPDGARVLMKWNSMLVDNEMMGGYAEARDPDRTVDYVTNDAQFKARYPYPIIGAFGRGWDDLETFTPDFPRVARTKSDPTRRVIVSNELDFFHDFETNYGPDLPAVSKSFGNEWDILCTYMAEVSATVKRSLATLRSGEALATLASLSDAKFMDGRTAARDRASMDFGLYWEHDWTGNGKVANSTRAAWQRKLAGEIASYADTLEKDALAALGDLVPSGGSRPRFVVFNPLSFRREDVADLPFAASGTYHVIDVTSGAEVPSQVVTDAAGTRLRILASNVPGVGYRVYEVRPGAGKNFGPAGLVKNDVIQNPSCRLTVSADGSIQQYVDKTRNNRDFAGSIDGRELNDLRGDGSGTLSSENVGPVSVTLVATSTSPLNHTTRVTLVRDSDRVRIDNEITAGSSRQKEWAFSFRLPEPMVHHEEVGAIALARLEPVNGAQSGGTGIYSNHAARYDWLTFNHFADVTSARDGVGCTVANLDCYFFQLGRSQVDLLDTVTPRVTALALGPITGQFSSYGIQNQDGDSYFRQRFALRTHDAYDPVDSMRMALEAESPLLATAVTGGNPKLPADRFELFENANPAVILWALKPAEEGIENGVIARLWNVTDDAQSSVLQLHPRAIEDARATTHIETDLGSLDVGASGLPVDFAPQQMKTFRLLLSTKPDVSGT